MLIAVGIAALAGSGMDRVSESWERAAIAALVSIAATFGAFYGALLPPGDEE